MGEQARGAWRRGCPWATRVVAGGLIGIAAAGVAGCEDPREQFGKIYYLDGAGNWGFGVADVPQGLREAGWEGSIEVFLWTSTFNPAADQVALVLNKSRAALLTSKIEEYRDRYPDTPVHIIALSAGTGVATWAVEGLRPGCMIDNLVLLGSSLSYDYDMTKALEHIRGRVYVYVSPYDEVLTTAVRTLGTVDRKFVDSAGLVGLKPNGQPHPRVVNIYWNERFRSLNWMGGHTDCTNVAFVRAEIAPRLNIRPVPHAEGESVASASPHSADR